MRNNKGFTLIELLAVIVILAIILAIAVPKILLLIERSRESANEVSKKILLNSIKDQITSSSISTDNKFISINNCYFFDFDKQNDQNENSFKLKIKNKEQFKGSITYCPSSGFQDDTIEISGNSSEDQKVNYTYYYYENGSLNETTTQNFTWDIWLQKSDGIEACGSSNGSSTCFKMNRWDCNYNSSTKTCNNSDGYIMTKKREVESLCDNGCRCYLYSSYMLCYINKVFCRANDDGRVQCGRATTTNHLDCYLTPTNEDPYYIASCR